MFTKLKNRWNDQDLVGDDIGRPKIFSKDWFIAVLWAVVAILVFIGFVLITGDKFEVIFRLLAFGGLCLMIGIAFGISK